MPKAKKEAPKQEAKETSQQDPASMEEKDTHVKGKVTKITDGAKRNASLEEKLNQLTDTVSKLLDKSERDDKEKQDLLTRLSKQDEVLNPQTGPGPACEAYKVHYGSALQLRMTEEPGVYEPVPVGMKVRQHDMINFLVKEDTPDGAPMGTGMIADCRSLYTDEFDYFLPKKPGQTVREKARVHLCRKHANVLLGISEEQKVGGINEVNEHL